MTTVVESYANELEQAKLDHQQPTAGAMVSHVLANLIITWNKLRQGHLYLAKIADQQLFTELAQSELNYFEELSEHLVDLGELVPTTLAEYVEYAMIQESGQDKYESRSFILERTVKDFDVQNMFITRAIKLSQQAEQERLAQILVALMAFNQHQCRLLQGELGKSLFEDRTEDDY